MNHWIIMPLLLPLLAGVLLLMGRKYELAFQRWLSVIATAALLLISIALLAAAAGGGYQVYALGNWPAPFGIILVLDRLSALMLVLTAMVALFSLVYALRGTDAEGHHFHALFQFQLLGLNGAFLTGDLFNLFVFFEVLLIASYGLLLHGGGAARTRAGLHYVLLNLVGSALFLFAVGILYGITGTLNMADLALKVSNAPPEHAALLRTGALLLLVVFALKAALLPLYFWLPSAYSTTSTPVAALFAIMTKVGVYAIVRIFTLAFGVEAGVVAHVAAPWLLPVALATLAAGMVGALASQDLRTLIAYLVVVSVGMLLTATGLFSVEGLSAALVYLIHTTLVTAGMFILADIISIQRGDTADRLEPGAPVAQPLYLGVLFFAGAVAIVGMPPLSGFIGKFMILQASQGNSAMGWIWAIVLVTSLLGLVALSRAGSVLFWQTKTEASLGAPITITEALPVVALLACSPLLVVLGGPVSEFANATAWQLLYPAGYIESVLDTYADAIAIDPGGQP